MPVVDLQRARRRTRPRRLAHAALRGDRRGVAFMLSYATQTAVAFVLARRVYPIRYEPAGWPASWRRASLAAVAGVWMLPEMPPVAGLLLRAAVTVAVFAAGSGGHRLPARDRAGVCRGDDWPVPPAAARGAVMVRDTAAATKRSASACSWPRPSSISARSGPDSAATTTSSWRVSSTSTGLRIRSSTSRSDSSTTTGRSRSCHTRSTGRSGAPGPSDSISRTWCSTRRAPCSCSCSDGG